MIKIAWVMLMSLLVVNAMAQGKVVATITNLKNDKGMCRVCLFNNPESFKGETGQPIACEVITITNKISQAIFNNVAPGNYAILVFHDENQNHKFDKNFLGIPKEGYGASKNKLPFAAAPSFSENMFAVGTSSIIQLSIRLRYL